MHFTKINIELKLILDKQWSQIHGQAQTHVFNWNPHTHAHHGASKSLINCYHIYVQQQRQQQRGQTIIFTLHWKFASCRMPFDGKCAVHGIQTSRLKRQSGKQIDAAVLIFDTLPVIQSFLYVHNTYRVSHPMGGIWKVKLNFFFSHKNYTYIRCDADLGDTDRLCYVSW